MEGQLTGDSPLLWRVCAFMLLVVLGTLACGCGDSRSGTADDAELGELLSALGYADFTTVAEEYAGKSGVTLHRSDIADPGFNLFNTQTENRAVLVDMEGRTVHEWYSSELEDTWHHVEMTPDGDLFVLEGHRYIARLDWHSNVLWRRDIAAHHDVQLLDDRVYVLDKELRAAPLSWGRGRFMDNAIAVLDTATGAVLDRTFFSEILSHAGWSQFLGAWKARLRGRAFDVFHVNSLEYVDRDLGGHATAGTFLVCVREFDLLAFIDLEQGRPIWTWGPAELDAPHQPSIMANGHLLVFDNGVRRGWSRILEIDIASREIVWEYRGTPPESFYTRRRGGAQELPNGNILVAESDDGRAFEITKDGEIVWEFFNPDVSVNDRGETVRGTIYRMTRLPEAMVSRLLEPQTSKGLVRQ